MPRIRVRRVKYYWGVHVNISLINQLLIVVAKLVCLCDKDHADSCFTFTFIETPPLMLIFCLH